MAEFITGQADTSGELAAIIGTAPMIVFVDGIDDVPVRAPALLRLLTDCPQVTVVATARVPFGMQGIPSSPWLRWRCPNQVRSGTSTPWARSRRSACCYGSSLPSSPASA